MWAAVVVTTCHPVHTLQSTAHLLMRALNWILGDADLSDRRRQMSLFFFIYEPCIVFDANQRILYNIACRNVNSSEKSCVYMMITVLTDDKPNRDISVYVAGL